MGRLMSISTLMCSLTRKNPPGFPKFQSSMTLVLASGRFLSGVLLFIPNTDSTDRRHRRIWVRDVAYRPAPPKWLHRTLPTAGAAGFLLLTQCRDRPETYSEPGRFDTML